MNMSKVQVNQFVHTLNYGDAISGEARTIQRMLRQMSIPSEIYSVHTHEKLKGQTRSWLDFDKEAAAAAQDGLKTAVILHYSIASPLNQLFLQQRDAFRAAIFHNLTPVHWFERCNARVAADLRQGFAELPEVMGNAHLVLADSEFNCQELAKLGCVPAGTLPLLLDEEQWAVVANAGINSILRAHGGKNILHVGRIAPNKRIEDIIKAFYFYRHKINSQSRLWLIGTDIDTEIYSFELRRLVSELQLRDAVFFVGSVSASELRAFYEQADLYICLSKHEGFCMPILEAMHFSVPVIAYDAGAVAETLGSGGILVGRKRPAEIAELMEIILTDNLVRSRLVEQGRKRAAAFSLSRFRENLENRLLQPIIRHFERSAHLAAG